MPTLVKVLDWDSCDLDPEAYQYFTSVEQAREYVSADADMWFVEGVLTVDGFRRAIPRNADGSISYRHPHRRHYVRQLKKGETVNLSQLARIAAAR